MFNQLGEIAPKALIVGGLGWAIVNWAVLGPELGSRTLHADGHIKMCKKGYAKNIIAAAREDVQKIPLPIPDPQKEAAVQSMRNMMRSPLGDVMKFAGRQSGFDINDTLRAYERQKENAVSAYKRALEAAKSKTSSKLGKAGDYCGCVADEAVSLAQNEFAIYSGTLTLVRPAKIRDLDKLMITAQVSGLCARLNGGSS